MYKVHETINEMLRDRGYEIKQMTKDELKLKKPQKEIFTCGKKNLLIIWVLGTKIKIDTINNLYSEYRSTDINNVIIVTDIGTTPPVKHIIPRLRSQGFKVEIFDISELKFNITKHRLVPKHIPLSQKEKMEIVNEYKCKESDLPKISINDPISRYFGLERGTLVKIIRNKETTTSYVTYRIVS